MFLEPTSQHFRDGRAIVAPAAWSEWFIVVAVIVYSTSLESAKWRSSIAISKFMKLRKPTIFRNIKLRHCVHSSALHKTIAGLKLRTSHIVPLRIQRLAVLS